MDNQNNEKRKPGRPRIYTEVPDCEKRDRVIAAMTKSNRYYSNEEFRQMKKEKNKIYYESRKNKIK